MTPHLKQAIQELIRAYDQSRINHYGFVLDIHRDVLDDLELAWIDNGKQKAKNPPYTYAYCNKHQVSWNGEVKDECSYCVEEQGG